MSKFLGPGNITDMDESINTHSDINKYTEVSDRFYFAFNDRSHWILKLKTIPWIFLKLLQTQANSLALRVNFKNFTFHFITHVNELRRVFYAFCPRHF